MAQFNITLDPVYGTSAEVRVCKQSTGEAVTFTVRNGETVVSDDPEFVTALQSLLGLERPVLAVRGSRPASPTHDVDRKPRAPAPEDAR